jgi:2-(1,2-epoxy-1,2-dihydrophenyl)acetyl-CoA isomerase
MAYKALRIDREGQVAIVTLNRPDAGNALDFRLMVEVDDAMRVVGEDADVRAVVLTGAGKNFCTGVDLGMFTNAEALVEKEGGEPEIQPQPDDQTYGKGTVVGAVVRIRAMPKPVIAAINGAVVGAGLSLVLGCDMRIASELARFGMVFVKRGIVPDTGGSFTLPRIVGLPKACELVLTGETIDAAEAGRIGLVSKVVPHDDLLKEALALAGNVAKNPPLAVKMAKENLYQAMAETDILGQMKREEASQSILLNTEDFQEAAVAFLEKREPKFKGR